jgi:hypothetical protein
MTLSELLPEKGDELNTKLIESHVIALLLAGEVEAAAHLAQIVDAPDFEATLMLQGGNLDNPKSLLEAAREMYLAEVDDDDSDMASWL